MLIELMAEELKLPADFVAKTISSANNRYKEFRIPKRNGAERLIQHPARRLKILQRWISKRVLSQLPVHASAKAYRKGSSIQVNAQCHIGQRFLLKIDFEDFFSSIKLSDVERLLRINFPLIEGFLQQNDIPYVAAIVCRRGALVIGAPSSPAVSNAVLYDFDRKVSEYCELRGVIYTRYADDITFSCSQDNLLFDVLRDFRAIVSNTLSPRLTINEDKVHHSSRKRRMRVTGLVLTPDNKLSIGRPNKRYLRSLIYQHIRGKLSLDQCEYLRGYLSFAKSVEPQLVLGLQEKYGFSLMDGQIVFDESGRYRGDI